MKIGVSELIVVLIVALLVLGPDKLPRYARKLGAALAEFRKASDEAARDIRENVVGPLEEAQRPLREAAESVEDAGRAVRTNLDDVKSSLENVGRAEKSAPESVTAPETQTASGNAETSGTQAASENAETSETQAAPDTPVQAASVRKEV